MILSNLNINKYSKNEIQIGTWIDDTPVYRKVIEYNQTEPIGNNEPATFIQIPHNISNLRYIISISSIISSGWLLPVVNTLNTDYLKTFTGVSKWTSTSIELRIFNDMWTSGKIWYFILEYVKN